MNLYSLLRCRQKCWTPIPVWLLLRSCKTHENHCYINGMKQKLNSGSCFGFLQSWLRLHEKMLYSGSDSTPAPDFDRFWHALATNIIIMTILYFDQQNASPWSQRNPIRNSSITRARAYPPQHPFMPTQSGSRIHFPIAVQVHSFRTASYI